MKARTKIVALLAAATVVALSGCASGAATTTSAGSATKFEKKSPLKFGYSVYDLQDPYFQRYSAGIKAEAAKHGISVVVSDQKDSQQIQVSGSANLINQGISALIISPIQPDALPTTINAAHAAKIPVVVGDVGVKGDYDTYILSDNEAGGRLAADWYIKQFENEPGTHQIGIIGNQPGVIGAAQRVAGFKKEIAAKAKNIEIVGDLAGQTIEKAYSAGQDLLSAHPKLEGIFCSNSNNVQGATRAAQTAGRDDLKIVGFNGDPIELDLIAQGKEAATVAQDPYGQGKAAVDAALQLLDGKTPPYTIKKEKTIQLPTELVDKSNLDEYKAKLAKQK